MLNDTKRNLMLREKMERVERIIELLDVCCFQIPTSLDPPPKKFVSKHLSFPSPSLGRFNSDPVYLQSWGFVSSKLCFETNSKKGRGKPESFAIRNPQPCHSGNL